MQRLAALRHRIKQLLCRYLYSVLAATARFLHCAEEENVIPAALYSKPQATKGPRSSISETGHIAKTLEPIMSRIAAGESVAPSEMLPYLCLELREERCEVNAMLASAYTQAGTQADLQQAKVFIQRAWQLSGFSTDLLPLYIKVFSALNDIAGIREAYKRTGITMTEQGNIGEAIRYFNLWQYAYATYNKTDKYEYDFDILGCIDRVARPMRFHSIVRTGQSRLPQDGGKIHLVYLANGISQLNSILIKINLELAKHHDKSRFDVTFVVPESDRAISESPQGRSHIEKFESYGCRVLTGPDQANQKKRIIEIAKSINDIGPHIFVASAALADFTEYFIVALRPAPVVVGLVQGPPPQFATPVLDWCISWSRHPLMDCPVDCSIVELKLDWTARSDDSSYSRGPLGVPDDACILMSGGRFPKFQEPSFWKAIADVLASHPNTYYFAVGVKEEQIPFLNSVLLPDTRERIRCLGWREDFLNVLRLADIVIDTYPSGGGQVLVEAMSYGIPIVSHKNDYMKSYDQTNWSPAEDFIHDSEIIVPRGDFGEFKRVISRLIDDKTYRRITAENCRQQVYQGRPEQGVRQCEAIYTELLRAYTNR